MIRRGCGRTARHVWSALLLSVIGLAGISCASSNTMPAVGQPLPPRSASLRWKYTPGAELVYVMSMETENELPRGMGTSSTHFENRYRWSIVDVTPDGEASIRVTFERIRLSIGTAMGSMSYDSDSPSSADAPGRILGAMVGMSYTLVVDTRGGVSRVDGLEDVRDRIGDAQLSNPAIGNLVQSTFTDEQIKNAWGQGLLAFPEEPISGRRGGASSTSTGGSCCTARRP